LIVEYNGKSVDTDVYTEITEEERADLERQFFEKPDLDIVKKQMIKINDDGVMADKINRYYFRELMAKTLCHKTKWTIEEVFKSKEVLGIFKAKTLTNKKVFPDEEPLIRNIDTAIRLGGKSYAKFPTNYPIKSVKAILSQYSINDNYYDFSCGWGSRLLGALSLQKNYYGTDPNYLLVDKLNELTNDYKDAIPTNNSLVDIRAQGSEIFIPEWENKMGIAFSSPPYYNLEDYQIGDQSYKSGVSYESWKANYLQPTLQNIYKYLIDGGYFCINIKNFNQYHLIEDTKNMALITGFNFITIELLTNNSRNIPLGEVNNSEGIFIFQKPKNTIKKEKEEKEEKEEEKEEIKEKEEVPKLINNINDIFDIYLIGAKSKKQLNDNNFWTTVTNNNDNRFLGERYYAVYNSKILELFPQYEIGKIIELDKADINKMLQFCIYHKDNNNSFKGVPKLCEILDNWDDMENQNYHIFLQCENN